MWCVCVCVCRRGRGRGMGELRTATPGKPPEATVSHGDRAKIPIFPVPLMLLMGLTISPLAPCSGALRAIPLWTLRCGGGGHCRWSDGGPPLRPHSVCPHPCDRIHWCEPMASCSPPSPRSHPLPPTISVWGCAAWGCGGWDRPDLAGSDHTSEHPKRL